MISNWLFYIFPNQIILQITLGLEFAGSQECPSIQSKMRHSLCPIWTSPKTSAFNSINSFMVFPLVISLESPCYHYQITSVWDRRQSRSSQVWKLAHSDPVQREPRRPLLRWHFLVLPLLTSTSNSLSAISNCHHWGLPNCIQNSAIIVKMEKYVLINHATLIPRINRYVSKLRGRKSLLAQAANQLLILS